MNLEEAYAAAWRKSRKAEGWNPEDRRRQLQAIAARQAERRRDNDRKREVRHERWAKVAAAMPDKWLSSADLVPILKARRVDRIMLVTKQSLASTLRAMMQHGYVNGRYNHVVSKGLHVREWRPAHQRAGKTFL